MKRTMRTISTILCALIIFAATAPVTAFAAAKADYTPGDVAKVFIETTAAESREYAGCKIRIIDEKGGEYEEIYDEGAKFKIRGNSTSSGAKKPYNVKFSSKTDVLGMGKNKKWCLLANCYEKTLMRNQMVFDFAKSIGLAYTPKYRVVELYYNGRNRGIYLLTDAIQVSESRIDLDLDDHEYVIERDARTDEGTTYFSTRRYGIRFGINEPEEPTAEQLTWLMSFLDKAENALRGGDMEQIGEYFDIPSMIDFYIVLEFFKNVDIDVGSTRFYVKDGKIYGGPCWDFDLSSGNCDFDYYNTYNNKYGSQDSAEGLWADKMWYSRLLQIEGFRSAVKDRYLELQNKICGLYGDVGEGENYVDRILDRYGKAYMRNYRDGGWSIAYKYSTLEHTPVGSYFGEIDFLRDWLKRRNEWMLNHYRMDTFLTLKEDAPISIDGFVIKDVPAKTTVGELEAWVEQDDVTVNTALGSAAGKSVLAATGTTIDRGGVKYTVVIRGDPIGDGKVTAVDYVFIKRAVLKTVPETAMTYLRSTAADVNRDGRITAVDYAMVRRHAIGKYDIYA